MPGDSSERNLRKLTRQSGQSLPWEQNNLVHWDRFGCDWLRNSWGRRAWELCWMLDEPMSFPFWKEGEETGEGPQAACHGGVRSLKQLSCVQGLRDLGLLSLLEGRRAA